MSGRVASQWLDYDEVHASGEHTVTGTVRVLPALDGPGPLAPRDLLVYLPPSWRKAGAKFPVLYMQDGQNLFDEATSFAGEWGVDESLERLAADEGLEAIVVGIPNAGARRLDEYSPVRDARLNAGGLADTYLSFLIEDVKPRVDEAFPTLPQREHTGILGSSMGGLAALYAFFRYPDVFGFAGGMSPSVWFGQGALLDIVRRAPYRPGRLYLDMGTAEWGQRPRLRDRLRFRRYPRDPRGPVGQLAELLRGKGWRDGVDLCYVEAPGAGHNEVAWRQRFPAVVRFLLGKSPASGARTPGSVPD